VPLFDSIRWESAIALACLTHQTKLFTKSVLLMKKKNKDKRQRKTQLLQLQITLVVSNCNLEHWRIFRL